MISKLYHYKANVVRVIDGDTIEVDCDVGFCLSQTMRLRLLGIDAAELRTKDPVERVMGRAAKEALVVLLEGRDVVLRTEKADSFGRYLADVWLGEMNVSDWLVANEYAQVR